VSERTYLSDLAIALIAVEKVLESYDAVHERKWETQSVAVHIRHCVEHLEMALHHPNGERARGELAHAATRALMALTLA
jgi:hypothetical protein